MKEDVDVHLKWGDLKRVTNAPKSFFDRSGHPQDGPLNRITKRSAEAEEGHADGRKKPKPRKATPKCKNASRAGRCQIMAAKSREGRGHEKVYDLLACMPRVVERQ